jgi:hydroxyacylglutathione hydrolase
LKEYPVNSDRGGHYILKTHEDASKQAQRLLRQLAVPTPYLVGNINAYSCEVEGGLVLFDTGPATDKALNYLKNNVDLDRLQYVFITHWHPEHCGLAAFLEKRTGATIIVSMYEASRLEKIEDQFNYLRGLFAGLGFPEEEGEQLVGSLRQLHEGIPSPDNIACLEESEELLETLGIEYFYCPFHSARDVIYLVGNNAVTGDIVLQETYSSPCIEPDPLNSSGKIFNNYRAFCTAISQLKKLINCYRATESLLNQ